MDISMDISIDISMDIPMDVSMDISGSISWTRFCFHLRFHSVHIGFALMLGFLSGVASVGLPYL